MASRAEIGEKIRQSRKNLGFTQQELAKKSGVNKSTISEIENGHFRGSYEIFESLLKSVGLQFEGAPLKATLPSWHDIDKMFEEDD